MDECSVSFRVGRMTARKVIRNNSDGAPHSHPPDLLGSEVLWSIANALTLNALDVCVTLAPRGEPAVVLVYHHTCVNTCQPTHPKNGLGFESRSAT